MIQHDERLSAFVDGELEQVEADRLISDMLSNPELRSRWLRYQRAGSALRHEGDISSAADLLAGVQARLASEPTLFAPQHRRRHLSATFKQVAGMAIAATVAAVAVLMIQPAEKAFGPGASQVAKAPVAEQQEWLRVNTARWSDDRPAVVMKLNSYLVNHNGYSTAVRGTMPYAPIVTAGNNARPARPDEDAPAIEYLPGGDNASR
ncbi:sigma-E factor negative regulatory protein [Sulfuriflexus sp.]|uniref:sigma-E factor negative regulatory protein n=1 Tax=Sulfuriflexus sp. TaxID=2015443 RepID=UPI0028CC2F25|nr:sigma-E factor negative regulatory protein [Sulfuriflexus sp.]MDT8405383.1 sigma-E factor negative regulatory protein [Sulfuriflexus sp.]